MLKGKEVQRPSPSSTSASMTDRWTELRDMWRVKMLCFTGRVCARDARRVLQPAWAEHVSSGPSKSQGRKGAIEASLMLWHCTVSIKRRLTETNDRRSFRNNFLLIWSKFSTWEQYIQSQTVRLHPGPHKSEFTERERKILKRTMRATGNLAARAACLATPSPPRLPSGSQN